MLSSIEETVNEVFGVDNPLTKLVVDLKGKHPDDAFSSIPYEKGSTFLWYLEELVGGADEIEPFLRAYYNKFMFKSIHSDDFKVEYTCSSFSLFSKLVLTYSLVCLNSYFLRLLYLYTICK